MTGDIGSQADHPIDAVARAQADEWVVRLHGDDAGEEDWLAFEAWLSAAPANRGAYDQAESLWAELGDSAGELRAMLDAPVGRPADRRPDRRRLLRFAFPAALAATVAVLGGVIGLSILRSDPAPVTYAAPRGQTRSIRLEDGTSITLNGGSKIAVVMGRRSRRVTMGEAEAAFDVAKDPSRPFLVAAGDQQVRVVGTEFNVLHHDGEVAVTVRRGVVEVRPAAAAKGPAAARLRPGTELIHHQGAAGYDVRKVDPNPAFAWKDGYLVFQARPLSEVVSALNRYFAVPVAVDRRVAGLKFTGVLQIDREDRMLARLQAFLPIKANRDARGYRLSSRI